MARTITTLTAPLFYFFFFFSLLSHQTMSQPQHIYTICDPSKSFTKTSSYEANRQIVLSSLLKSSSLGTYSNATFGLSPDTVHGMFLCRGDSNAKSCLACVLSATIEIATNCSLNKAAVTYFQKCMVRYSDVSFLKLMEIRPGATLHLNQPAPNLKRFNQTLSDKFDKLIQKVSSSSLIPYFVEDKERVTQPESSYELDSMVQCSPDLDPSNCTVCLRTAFSIFYSTCCGLPSVFQIFTLKCLLRYETTVLRSTPSSPPALPSQSFSIYYDIKGNEIFGKIVVTVTALLVLALVDL